MISITQKEFILHLVGTAEYMGIVLREAPHTCQAMKLAALLVTAHCTEFGNAQR